ncbi:CPBP family intramembrane glutamic endopeptidase [Neobacillus drentensis]|uniref:CPBP family intramembrane glutamic endopeptidase n=1 Tax=Neobacillus drentensis TaxID=220684 RepID=UPI002FFEEBF8
MNQKGIWLSLYFLIMMLLFTRGFYTPFFVFLIALLLFIGFLNETNRLFAWIIIGFFLANIVLVYIDNFIEGFHFSPFSLVLVTQILWVIPILMIIYVIKQFKYEVNLRFTGKFSLKRYFLIFVLFTSLAFIGTGLFQQEEIHWRPFLLILAFSTINAILEEVLWRGILLPKLIRVTNTPAGLIVTSFAFGINTTMFGYSLIICIVYFCIGLFLGLLTVKSKSIFPSIVVHAILTTLLLLVGFITIPVL